MELQKQKRNRGLILTLRGWQKLQNAKVEWEFQENSGEKCSIEDVSERVGLTPVTFRKVLTREVGVDKQTIVRLFMAFNLELDKSDYKQPETDLEKPEAVKVTKRVDWGEVVCVSALFSCTEFWYCPM